MFSALAVAYIVGFEILMFVAQINAHGLAGVGRWMTIHLNPVYFVWYIPAVLLYLLDDVLDDAREKRKKGRQE